LRAMKIPIITKVSRENHFFIIDTIGQKNWRQDLHYYFKLIK